MFKETMNSYRDYEHHAPNNYEFTMITSIMFTTIQNTLRIHTESEHHAVQKPCEFIGTTSIIRGPEISPYSWIRLFRIP